MSWNEYDTVLGHAVEPHMSKLKFDISSLQPESVTPTDNRNLQS